MMRVFISQEDGVLRMTVLHLSVSDFVSVCVCGNVWELLADGVCALLSWLPLGAAFIDQRLPQNHGGKEGCECVL